MQLGGGSNNDFLLSLHRLDQPCSGVILFAKTSKAASRITALWKKKMVEKEYLCVVSAERVERLLAKAAPRQQGDAAPWRSLWGTIQSSETSRSVVVRSTSSRSSEHAGGDRKVSISFKVMELGNWNRNFMIVRVKTKEGSRHMVRAMLAQVGECPIAGDMRYGYMDQKALKDHSVALHAFRLRLDTQLELGSLQTFAFQAPIPRTWNDFFGVGPTTTFYI
jgi:23S rRNA pseudouridine1911/1915/1917 synthase